MTIPTADKQRLVLFLCHHCRGREQRMLQRDVAAKLGWSVRYLQDVASEEAQTNGRIGSSSGRYAGMWWSLDAEDAQVADSNLAGRIGPLARRRRAIARAFPGLGQGRLLEV